MDKSLLKSVLRSIFVPAVLAAWFLGATGCNPAKVQASIPAKVDPPPAAQAKKVEVLVLEAKPFQSRIKATGTALAAQESYLSAPISGTVAQILVKVGDRVKKGQILLRFDPTGFRLAGEQAQAGIDAARTQVDSLKLELDRTAQLTRSDAVSTATLDRVKAQYDVARAQLEGAQVALKQTNKALNDTEIRAPYNGVIVDILKDIGEFAPSMPPTNLIRIVDDSYLEVQAFLPEENLEFAKTGSVATVSVESIDLATTGRVIFVSDRIDPDTQTFEVRIHIDNQDRRIKAGSFCRITMDKRSLPDAILIPARAVRRDTSGAPFVFVEREGKARTIPVKLGESDGAQILLIGGLAAGDKLITSGLDDLADGDAVQLAAKES